jgi:prolipoprotein diacylglyceryltransferase
MIAAITVNFKREAFFIPGLDIPVYWYGVLFALGYFLSSILFSKLIFNHIRKQDRASSDKTLKKEADSLTQSISFYLLIGLVIGARVGHVAFYEGFDKLLDLKFLLNIRDGGLASHGATADRKSVV